MLSRLQPSPRLVLKLPKDFSPNHCRLFGDNPKPFPSPYPHRPALKSAGASSSTDPNESKGSDSDRNSSNDSKMDNDGLLRDQSGALLNEHKHSGLHPLKGSAPAFYRQHHFDTHKLVQSLEQQGFSRTQAEVIMKGIKFKLRESAVLVGNELLLRSDLENESYLFKAELSELRTEIQIMRRNDTQMLQTDAALVTREVETLAQRLREDVTTMKNDVTLDMNNRKNETQEEQKAIDMKIQEINNKFTVQMGEVRTELESVRWETIWKGMAGVVAVGVSFASLGYLFTRFADRQAEAVLVEKHKRRKLFKEEARQSGAADMEVIY